MTEHTSSRAGRSDRPLESQFQLLTVPGYTNSGPAHWQSMWEKAHPEIQRVEQHDWNRPEAEGWSAAIQEAVSRARKPAVLVAHSCGITAVAHWATRSPTSVAGAFLVAPADAERPDVDAPVRAFPFPALQPFPFPTMVIASEDDPYCTIERASAFASAWGAAFVNVGAAGHINTASGHGPWPEGWQLLTDFLARALRRD